MRSSAKLGLTALMAAMLLATAIGTASARNLSVSNTNLRITWSRLEFEGGLGAPLRCRVTLEGSFHRATIAKVARTLIGAISRADVDTANCTNGRMSTSLLPWHLTYESFTGTLPNITAVRLLLARYRFTLERPFGAEPTCTYGNATDNVAFDTSLTAGEATALRPVAGNSSTLIEARNDIFVRCPATVTMIGSAGDGLVRLLNSSTTRIRITLI